MSSEKDRIDTQKSLLFDLRLLIKGSDKQTYTKEEMLDFLDSVAEAKAQE